MIFQTQKWRKDVRIHQDISTHIVGHHDREQGLVARVDGHVEGSSLEQDEHSVEEDVDGGEAEVSPDAPHGHALAGWTGLGRRPKEGVDCVLTEGGEQPVADLLENGNKIKISTISWWSTWFHQKHLLYGEINIA